MFWTETDFNKPVRKSFEDGLNDARREMVDPIAYRLNREYQKGVDIARRLMAKFDRMIAEMRTQTEPPLVISNTIIPGNWRGKS